MGSLALRETFKSFFTSWRGPLPKGMVPEQKLRKFYDRAKARGRDFPCMGHLGPLGFCLDHTLQNQCSLASPLFSPMFSVLETARKEIKRQKVSLEPHTKQKKAC